MQLCLWDLLYRTLDWLSVFSFSPLWWASPRWNAYEMERLFKEHWSYTKKDGNTGNGTPAADLHILLYNWTKAQMLVTFQEV
jgi:hypothetical protein